VAGLGKARCADRKKRPSRLLKERKDVSGGGSSRDFRHLRKEKKLQEGVVVKAKR